MCIRDRVHARHILLKPSPIMTDEQARVKLEQIAADIKSGCLLYTSDELTAIESNRQQVMESLYQAGWRLDALRLIVVTHQ